MTEQDRSAENLEGLLELARAECALQRRYAQTLRLRLLELDGCRRAIETHLRRAQRKLRRLDVLLGRGLSESYPREASDLWQLAEWKAADDAFRGLHDVVIPDSEDFNQC